MSKELLELYSDYLISSFSYTTATGLSGMLDGLVPVSQGTFSHDKVTRFLGSEAFDAKKLWQSVKPLVRKYERDEGVLVVDDTIIEKPYTDESTLVCWHYDHSKGRSVKGINLVNVIYESGGVRLPVNYAVVEKDQRVWDEKKGKEVRKSSTSKNEQVRLMLKACVQNRIKFRTIIADTWYSAAATMTFIAQKLERSFLLPLKSNRKVALSKHEKEQGQYQAVSSLALEQGQTYQVWVEQCSFPLLLTKLVFRNEDATEGTLYLVTNDLTLAADQMDTLYQRRWSVEEFHASIKGNTSLAASPTKSKRTQLNHVFASIYSFVKLEVMRVEVKLNHFALRSKLYVKALQASFAELRRLKASSGLA
jgi:hypothetical protein